MSVEITSMPPSGITSQFIGQFCVVRTTSAGVHMGVVKEIHGTNGVLANSRRLWRWRGANTLSEVSQKGVDESYSRISEPEPIKLLTECIEFIPCSAAAQENLSRSRWPA